MTAQKQAESVQAKLPTGRKPWKKKSPVEVVLDQIDRIKQDVAEREEELKQARRQLQKLEDARKLLESA
jgi:uncharacterized protein (DUF3084 family)